MPRNYTRWQLEALASFLPVFTREDFVFATPPVSEDGEAPTVFATCILSLEGEAFLDMVINTGWVLPEFDWPEWAMTEEAARLRDDPAALENATAEQLARLITVLVRQEHFGCDAMACSFRSGLLNRIVKRANALSRGLRATSATKAQPNESAVTRRTIRAWP
jgi:hypothetical protein